MKSEPPSAKIFHKIQLEHRSFPSRKALGVFTNHIPGAAWTPRQANSTLHQLSSGCMETVKGLEVLLSPVFSVLSIAASAP